MKIKPAEIYQHVRQEVATHWKTGVVMTGVTIVVSQVYGKAAAASVVLVTVSHYDIIGKKFTVISWMSLRRVLIAVIVLGNNYYFSVLNPQIVSNLALALILFDNFQLSNINVDLFDQNAEMKKNEEKLGKAKEKLTTLKQALVAYHQTVDEAQNAKDANEKQAQALEQTVSSKLVADLENVNTLVEALMRSTDLQELMMQEQTLRKSIDSMLTTYSGICEKLAPLVPRLDKIGSDIEATTGNLASTVQISSQQISALVKVVETFETYKRVKV